jgi:hypothetical protein
MGYGAIEYEPFVSMQAHLKITASEEVPGRFDDAPVQVQVDLEVLDYEESEDDGGKWIGHTFRDWLSFAVDKNTGKIGISKSKKAKLTRVIIATIGEEYTHNGKFEPPMLSGHELRSRVARSGKDEDGNHSRLKAETVMPKPKRPKKDADLEGVDVESLDMSEAPDILKPSDEKQAS